METPTTMVVGCDGAATQCAVTGNSDERQDSGLLEQAQERLQGSAHGSVRSARCEYHEGVLVLSGRVPSYYHKQLAQEAVHHLPGIELILNVLEVDL